MNPRFRTAIVAVAAVSGMGIVAGGAAGPVQAETPAVHNVVLVHGAYADGSGWRGVYDNLTGRGYRVTVVQNPLTSLADDVAATQRVLDRQDGPTILVGHSYGGTVITEAGVDPKVVGLVYVSGLAPDIGESTDDQFAEIPPPPAIVIEPQADGFAFINLEKFKDGFAGDTSDAEAAFLRDSQVPTALTAFATDVSQAAWHDKPSWAVIAKQDQTIDPTLLRQTAQRIGAVTEEIDGSHVSFVTHPEQVADVIVRAAQGA